MTQWSMVSPFLSLLAVYAQLPGVSARRGGDGSSGGGGGNGGGRPGVAANSNSGPGDLNLYGFPAALFSFYVIFAIISTIQTLQALHLLSQRNANGSGSTPPFSVNTGIAYRVLLLLTPLTLVAAYTMGAIYIGVDMSENYYNRLRRYAPHFTPGFYACIDFLPVLAEVFFAAALLVLIRHRARLNQVSYWSGKSVIDGSLVLLLLICSIATTAIRTTTVTPANFDSMRNAYSAFTHLYVAFYIIMAINIVATTISVRRKTRHLVVQDQILRRIAQFICPFLAIRAIYKLISDILLWIPQTSVDYRALSLASLIILGFTFAIMIGVAVRLGLRGKAAARTGTVLQLPQQGKVLYTKGY